MTDEELAAIEARAGMVLSARRGRGDECEIRRTEQASAADISALLAEVRSLRAALETATREHAETRAKLAEARKWQGLLDDVKRGGR
jgi:hypothetical protein